jgi:hypothetical protein
LDGDICFQRRTGVWNERLRPLATSQAHGLAVLLQLGNELIALLDDVLVLLVLVIGAVRLDDTLTGDTVDSAGDAATSNELGKITVVGSRLAVRFPRFQSCRGNMQ